MDGANRAFLWMKKHPLIGFLGVVASCLALVAGNALSQSPAVPKNHQPTAAASIEPVLRTYVSPQADAAAAAKTLQVRFPTSTGVRIAPDARTGQLLIVAPPQVHAQLAKELKSVATESVSAPSGKREQSITKLQNSDWKQFEAGLAVVAGKQLPVSVDDDQKRATYTLPVRSGGQVTISVDRAGNQVAVEGPAELVAGWSKVVSALDAPPATRQDASRVL
ncbi:MAG: hypothetical protein SGJ20_16430, partial [Planctomycetota bacterium]|nr:hypothetical protein [Planctomycetota bacterium]